MTKVRQITVVGMIVTLAGCFTPQVFPTTRHQRISLSHEELNASGIAFITPSSATGQEEEKQALAMIFSEVFRELRPQVRVVGLPESLNAINRAGFSEDYRAMYRDYRDTGLFKRDTLDQIARLTGVRYIAQIKLQGFEQGAKERFGALGLRIIETSFARIRIFLQIWDGANGTISWEGMQEVHYAKDGFSDQPVTLQTLVERTARDLIARLP